MFLSGLKCLSRLERQVKFAKNRCCKIKPVAVVFFFDIREISRCRDTLFLSRPYFFQIIGFIPFYTPVDGGPYYVVTDRPFVISSHPNKQISIWMARTEP